MKPINKLKYYVSRVENKIKDLVDSKSFRNTPLIKIMRYALLSGGKRFRPSLVYIIGETLGVSLETLDAPAIAIECVHTYSLIHDDLPSMDNDHLRRGKPTCHIKFGEAKALLAGNALQALAFSMLTDSKMSGVNNINRLAMIAELAKASGVLGICTGQALDIEITGKKINFKILKRLYKYKTVSLIKAAARLSAFSAGNQGRKLLPIIDEYAKNIGLAFQARDDILDVIGKTSTLGKQSGTDKRLKKKTFPDIFSITNSQIKLLSFIKEAYRYLDKLKDYRLDISKLKLLTEYVIKRKN